VKTVTHTTCHPEFGDAIIDKYGRKGYIMNPYQRHCSNCSPYVDAQFEGDHVNGEYVGDMACPDICDLTWDAGKEAWVIDNDD